MALRAVGYKIEKYDDKAALTMKGALARCKERGVNVKTVIDIGASDGSWTRDCLKCFPDANYLLIEAQEPHQSALERLAASERNVRYVLAAAGRAKGKIYFDNSSLFGGLASEAPLKGSSIEVPVVSVDEEVKRLQLNGPFLIKLDTHGFEVPILEGAAKTLNEASLVIIETYNFQLTDSSLRFFEMCDYMKTAGFLCVEMVDFILRKRDLSFWQMDTFFIPSTSSEFTCQSFD